MTAAGGEMGADIAARTDSYFTRTRKILERFGDKRVTYAIFMRRPVICAPAIMVNWIEAAARERGIPVQLSVTQPEGDPIAANTPIAYLSGSMVNLSEMETILLQKIGPPCVAAFNAWQMCAALPRSAFLAMDARHCAGAEMQDLMAYGCAVGSRTAKRDGAIGFIGNANDATAHWFGAPRGFGTMPHSLIGYAGSTVRAAELFHETFPDEPMTVLADYFGQEVTDALAVCARFPDLAAAGRLSFRIDTHGGRYLEGLDDQKSRDVLRKHAPGALNAGQDDLKPFIGPGVSAAAIWRMRDALDEASYSKVRIVASSGFGVTKCRAMAIASAPIDVVGTGSFIPESWHETYATADIVEYDGKPLVKVGREFLLQSRV